MSGQSLKMKTFAKPPADVDEYISSFPPDVQKILKKIRTTVRKAAPGAEEKISYRIPAFFENGILIYFAAFKHHIGIFPPVSGDKKLLEEASVYAGPKGNLKFPLNKPIPYELIGRIVRSRLKASSDKSE